MSTFPPHPCHGSGKWLVVCCAEKEVLALKVPTWFWRQKSSGMLPTQTVLDAKYYCWSCKSMQGALCQHFTVLKAAQETHQHCPAQASHMAQMLFESPQHPAPRPRLSACKQAFHHRPRCTYDCSHVVIWNRSTSCNSALLLRMR